MKGGGVPMIEVGGYRIYWPVFALFTILIGVLVGFILLKLVRNLHKLNKKMNTISSWQKYNIITLLEERLEDVLANNDFSKEEKDYFSNVFNGLIGYIRRHRYWDVNEILEIDEKAIQVLDEVIFDKIKECVAKNQKNTAVLYCHAFDFANGGPVYTNSKILNWIGDDVEEHKNDLRMSPYEARCFSVMLSAVGDVFDLLDEDLDKIPEDIEVDNILRTYNSLDFEYAIEDLSTCNDIKNLKTETIDIAARSLLCIFDMYVHSFNGSTLPSYRLYTVRCLACCLDNCLYDEVLDSIDLR